MAIINMDICSVKALLGEPLTLPGYQRPYKWQTDQVNQLLDDVINHQHKSSYRLGTVVLHRDTSDTCSIVDGQQRLLTLSLLSTLLDPQQTFRSRLLEHPFSDALSQQNLRHSAAILHGRLRQLSEAERQPLLSFLLDRCELIVVRLDNLSEAFQFFDSQNARGKELEPHDLLKAFHLREMTADSEQQRSLCVARWEEAVAPDPQCPASPVPIPLMMSDYLFRLRRWMQGYSAHRFTRRDIHVFKGVSPTRSDYPYAAALRALDFQVDRYNHDPVRLWDRQLMVYPFQLNQVMLNGKRFFEYVHHYSAMFRRLFIEDKPQLSGLMATLNSYQGRSRRGDRYVRNLFCCAVLFYYDKFGDAQLEKAASLCFLWSYRLRLQQYRVVIESVDNLAREQGSLLSVIASALHPLEVLAFNLPPLTDIKRQEMTELQEKFKQLGGIEVC